MKEILKRNKINKRIHKIQCPFDFKRECQTNTDGLQCQTLPTYLGAEIDGETTVAVSFLHFFVCMIICESDVNLEVGQTSGR